MDSVEDLTVYPFRPLPFPLPLLKVMKAVVASWMYAAAPSAS